MENINSWVGKWLQNIKLSTKLNFFLINKGMLEYKLIVGP